MMWAVSQAAPLRRVEIEEDLCLYEYEPPLQGAGYASGGFFANLKVSGSMLLGSQQQFFGRDSTVNNLQGGAWNVVLTGVEGKTPPTHCGTNGGAPATNIDETPKISEKPFIWTNAAGKFFLQVPGLKIGSRGSQFEEDGGHTIDFESVYVTQPEDTATLMNEKLRSRLHLVYLPAFTISTNPSSWRTADKSFWAWAWRHWFLEGRL